MAVRFDGEKLQCAWRLLDRWVDADECPAVAAAAGGGTRACQSYSAGRQSPLADVPLADDAIFLIASPTKPITALAVLMLAEAGELLLVDPVTKFVPEFASHGKETITLAHCLTHTSGLPDMLPENEALRRRHAPLEEFVKGSCAAELGFVPGHAVAYQSMGYLMLAEVLQRVTGVPLPEFLRQRIFDPLGMANTALGMPDEWDHATATGGPARRDRIADMRLPPELEDIHWGWNSDYWRRLGAPWGGLLSTAGDLARLCRHLLSIHAGADGVVSQASLQAMTSNQLETMPHVPEVSRRCTPWGFGWQPNWPNHPRTFGDFLSPAAYGHWGSTGTMLWIDATRDAFAVLLTTEPLQPQQRRQARFSNALCAALSRDESDSAEGD